MFSPGDQVICIDNVSRNGGVVFTYIKIDAAYTVLRVDKEFVWLKEIPGEYFPDRFVHADSNYVSPKNALTD